MVFNCSESDEDNLYPQYKTKYYKYFPEESELNRMYDRGYEVLSIVSADGYGYFAVYKKYLNVL